MECQPNGIACRLDEITQAIGEPTWTDVATVIVAAIAALGTIFIASINIRLLAKQHKSELEDRLRVRFARRTAYGALVRRMATNTLFGRLRDDDEPEPLHDVGLAEQAELLGAETGEPSAEALWEWMMHRAATDPMGSWDTDALMTSLGDIEDGINKWAKEPYFPVIDGSTPPITK